MIVQIILVQNIFLDEFSSRVQDRRKRFENQKEKEREEISSNLIWYEMWRISLVDRREHTWAHFLQKTHTLLGLSTLRKGLGCPEGVFSPTFHTRRCENIWPRFRKISRPRNSRPPPFSLFYLLSGNSIHGKRFFFLSFFSFFSFRSSSSSWKWKKCHPSKREKNTRQRSIRKKNFFDSHYGLRKTISTTRNTLPSKIFDRRQRVKLESRYAIDARFRRKHRGAAVLDRISEFCLRTGRSISPL